MSDLQNERFRAKVQARNLGTVEVQTYPANPAAASQQRVASKLELHRLHGKVQGSEDPKPADPKPEAPAEAKPKADAKSK